MLELPSPLAPLGAWRQFVCWFAVPSAKPGKLDKLPCHWSTGDVIDAHNPACWTDAATALANAQRFDRGHGSGAGFVFTTADPFFFLDIDHCWDGASWSALATSLCARLPGVAVEVSTSGTGLHLIGRTAQVPHGCRNTPAGLELYTEGRFVALTGLQAVGDCTVDATPQLLPIIAEYFNPVAADGQHDGSWTTEPTPDYTGPADDDELIAKALAAAARDPNAAFGAPGRNPTFADLWEGRADVLASWKPQADSPTGYGRSEADQALANSLAFWTGKNCERMERLMRRSALARDKWDAHKTFLRDTIVGACGFIRQVYTQSAPAPVDLAAISAAAETLGRQVRDASREFMPPFEQLEHFAGCYYDMSNHTIYSVPRNMVFERRTFDVVYGGHMFIMDPRNAKTSDSAWDAFTASRVYTPVSVFGLCFRPELPSGALVQDGNRSYVNSYVPHDCVAIPGDVSRILDHLGRLLPDPGDYESFLSYLAGMAQNPGKKFQWWPVIQGAEGNGKSLYISIMTYVMGEQYTHLPNTHKLGKQGMSFNSWIYRKTFIGMEEIDLGHRRDFLEEFKVVITNTRIEVEGKGSNQFMGDNRVNGMLCTNHKSGVPITADTRRYGIYFTAQQSAEDIIHDGMGGDYFPSLWNWLWTEGGAARFAHYLKTYPLRDELNPAKMARAPKTSSTDEAIFKSFGPTEQEIMEAVASGEVGFRGDFVSSHYLAILCDRIRSRVSKFGRVDLMATLGYIYHPALPDGRVNNRVMPDGVKPRIYVKIGSPAAKLTKAVEVERAYSQAQQEAASEIFAPPLAANG